MQKNTQGLLPKVEFAKFGNSLPFLVGNFQKQKKWWKNDKKNRFRRFWGDPILLPTPVPKYAEIPAMSRSVPCELRSRHELQSARRLVGLRDFDLQNGMRAPTPGA